MVREGAIEEVALPEIGFVLLGIDRVDGTPLIDIGTDQIRPREVLLGQRLKS
jgi:hypothetical protein